MTEKIAKNLNRIVKKYFSFLSKPHQKSLSMLLAVFFDTPSFALYNIASLLPLETSNKHKYKHLIYFLDHFSINTEFWKSYISLIFSLPYMHLKRKKIITILLDATTLKDDAWILSASISYKERSIPIYVKMWKDVNEDYNYWDRVIPFVKEMRRYLPEDFSYVIIADRGFRGDKLPNLLKRLKMDYIIRINDSCYVKTKTGKEWMQLSLFDSGMYEGVLLSKSNPQECNLAVSKVIDVEEKKEKKWYLMTSLEGYSAEEISGLYSKRMWIEESFKDLKGLMKWENYTEKVPDIERLKKVLIISALSYAIQLSIGSSKEVQRTKSKGESIMRGLRNAMNSIEKRWNRILSIFVVLTIQNHYALYKLFS